MVENERAGRTDRLGLVFGTVGRLGMIRIWIGGSEAVYPLDTHGFRG